MVKFEILGFDSFNQYYEEFENTLLPSNHTYDFFVNWEKVYKNLEDSLIEIQILNSLNKVKKEDIENKFEDILIRYPKVVTLLPHILAIRDKKMDVLDTDIGDFKNIEFKENKFDKKEIIKFCKKSGLLDMFSHIGDLYSYLVGTEVGLDTHSRKSRSGKVFEDIVGDLLYEKIKDKSELRLSKEDTISFGRTKRWDYVIYRYDKPLIFFECNFYNSSGSKPIETVHAYVDLQKQFSNTDYIFVWVTDGQGWKKMSNSLKEVAQDINYIVNYKLLKNILDNLLD